MIASHGVADRLPGGVGHGLHREIMVEHCATADQHEIRARIKAFLRAFTKGMKDVLADPDGSIKYVKERDALVDETLEKRRMKLAIESVIATPEAKRDGLGGVTQMRLDGMVTQVSSAFEVKNPVKPDAIFNSTYLPPKADRMVFGK